MGNNDSERLVRLCQALIVLALSLLVTLIYLVREKRRRVSADTVVNDLIDGILAARDGDIRKIKCATGTACLAWAGYRLWDLYGRYEDVVEGRVDPSGGSAKAGRVKKRNKPESFFDYVIGFEEFGWWAETFAPLGLFWGFSWFSSVRSFATAFSKSSSRLGELARNNRPVQFVRGIAEGMQEYEAEHAEQNDWFGLRHLWDRMEGRRFRVGLMAFGAGAAVVLGGWAYRRRVRWRSPFVCPNQQLAKDFNAEFECVEPFRWETMFKASPILKSLTLASESLVRLMTRSADGLSHSCYGFKVRNYLVTAEHCFKDYIGVVHDGILHPLKLVKSFQCGSEAIMVCELPDFLRTKKSAPVARTMMRGVGYIPRHDPYDSAYVGYATGVYKSDGTHWISTKPGVSGAPLFDANGACIGVHSAGGVEGNVFLPFSEDCLNFFKAAEATQ